MRGFLTSLLVLALANYWVFGVTEGGWQAGRIVEIHKKVDSKPLYWIGNTPITTDEITYTITVHVGPKLLVGIYTVDKSRNAPPDEWTRGRPVKVELYGKNMYLKTIQGEDVKLRIVKTKATEALRAVSEAEMNESYTPPIH